MKVIYVSESFGIFVILIVFVLMFILIIVVMVGKLFGCKHKTWSPSFK